MSMAGWMLSKVITVVATQAVVRRALDSSAPAAARRGSSRVQKPLSKHASAGTMVS